MRQVAEVIVLTNKKAVAVYRNGIIIAFASDMARSKDRSFLTDVMHANGGTGYLESIPVSAYPVMTLLMAMNINPAFVVLPNLTRFPAFYENINPKSTNIKLTL